jgi:hypothetical protein
MNTIKLEYCFPIKTITLNETEDRSFQDWLGIDSIDNIIRLTNGKECILLKVTPINFKLKSNLEQKSILYEYQRFLKNINSKIQVIISTQKTDVSVHINQVLKSTKDNPEVFEMSKDYINLINQTVKEKNTITKEFYIVIENTSNAPNDILKIVEYLSNCGNEVTQCGKQEIKRLIQNFTNKRLANLM